MNVYNSLKSLSFLVLLVSFRIVGQNSIPQFDYQIAIQNPNSKSYQVDLTVRNWPKDTLVLHLPNWMPGYYQMMNYYKEVNNFKVHSGQIWDDSKPMTWKIIGTKGKDVHLAYDIYTDRSFVANSYVDSQRAYIVPVNSFLYVEDYLDVPVTLTVEKSNNWKDIATGLELVSENAQEALYRAPDFDTFFDSPLLMGNLKKLPAFKVDGVNHRFWGYKMGDFDENKLMNDLNAVVRVGSDIIGDIPFNEYTFIGIGPGRGGIEHLNSATISFNGDKLEDPEEYLRMLHFLAHEYFHHYNVKRIRPFELGPFDYQKGSKTTQLWISEGLTSYYSWLMVRRAGLSTHTEFLKEIATNIIQFENNPGKSHQSLIESSFETWHEGPFGKSGKDPSKSISYYVKGPIVGLLMDFGIRQATHNKKSLDDVMRFLYQEYYLKKGRGFTDAEFREACTTISKSPLTELFQYVYTPKPLDYNTYLGFAGLKLVKKQESKNNNTGDGKSSENLLNNYSIKPIGSPTHSQKEIFSSWMTGK